MLLKCSIKGQYRIISDMEVVEMMLFAVAALIHGSMLFGRALLEHVLEMTEPANKAVKAAVDGEPVYSYVLDVSVDEDE